MADMQFSFDNKEWHDVNDGPGIIPSKAIQVYFRPKPRWEYQVTWTNSIGRACAMRFGNLLDAIEKIKELAVLDLESNLYTRNDQ
jgi:hypothetical protein